MVVVVEVVVVVVVVVTSLGEPIHSTTSPVGVLIRDIDARIDWDKRQRECGREAERVVGVLAQDHGVSGVGRRANLVDHGHGVAPTRFVGVGPTSGLGMTLPSPVKGVHK